MSPDAALARVRNAAIILYAGAMAVILLTTGEPAQLSWWFSAVLFFPWTAAPIISPLTWRRCGWFLTLGVIAIAICSLFILWRDMFGPNMTSTSAMIFVFLPFYQWVAVALVAGLSLLFHRRRPQ